MSVATLCRFCRGKGCRQCLDTPEARAWRRERAQKSAQRSHANRAGAIRERLQKLATLEADPEGVAMVSVVLRPDFSTPETRRAFRESIVRAVVAGVIARPDAETLLKAAADQAREDEATPADPPIRMVPMTLADLNGERSDG